MGSFAEFWKEQLDTDMITDNSQRRAYACYRNQIKEDLRIWVEKKLCKLKEEQKKSCGCEECSYRYDKLNGQIEFCEELLEGLK